MGEVMNDQYRIEQTDLSEHAYERIKEMIFTNRLSSGQKLNQEQLAETLGVSRTPLLSAFHKLEKEMLVELVPRRGAFVKKLDAKEFDDLYDVRMRLEPLGALRAAELAKPADIKVLEQTLADFESAVNTASVSGFRAADYEFHMAIMRMSRNDILFHMIDSFSIIIISNLEGFNKDPRDSLREHKDLVDAISNGRSQDAEKVMYQHILGAKLHLMEKHGTVKPE